MPPNAPIEQYWSATAYDRETRADPRDVAPEPRVERHSSSEESGRLGGIYFGPSASAGKEFNWVPTNPKREFELLFRLHGPKKELFEMKWKLLDIETVN